MIIGLLGFAGSGKGTVADILVSEGFVKESFADPVKDAVAAIFGWPRFLLEGDTPESRLFRETVDLFWSEKFGYPVKPRHMLQLMGTEAGRNVFHTNVWCDALMLRASKNEHTVVADVRFPNEIEALHEAGAYLVRVKRGSEPQWYDLAKAANDPQFLHAPEAHDELSKTVHISEWAWIGNPLINETIENDGTLEDLERKVRHLLYFLKQSDTMLD